MKRVITYGTFDLLHHGHIRLLERAKAFGDHLTVAISSDEFNEGKGKKCIYPYEERAYILNALRMVDRVIPEKSWEQKVQDVVNFKIDTFVMGHDWEGKFNFLKDYCEVIYLPRTEGISTTQTKTRLGKSDV